MVYQGQVFDVAFEIPHWVDCMLGSSGVKLAVSDQAFCLLILHDIAGNRP